MRLPWQRPRPTTTAVSAAVKPLDPNWQRIARRIRQPWQVRAAKFAEEMGPVRFACGLTSNAGSRCALRPEKLVDPRRDEWEPEEKDHVPADALRQYRGKNQDQAELVRRHLWNLETVGEAIQLLEQDGNRVVWSIHSPLAIEWRADGVRIMDVPGGIERDGTARLVPYETVRRMWIPHETYAALATSPLRGVLRDCERLWSVQRRMQRTADSALGMAKAVWTPAEAHMGLPRETTTGDAGPGTTLERDYYQAAGRAFEDDDNIEGIVPMMWRWPKEYGAPQVVDLAQPFDDKAVAWVVEALERIGGGLDFPQRLLVDGGGDMNHWGAWLLEEQFAKNSLAPKLERVCWGDLTESFFRPALRALRAKGIWDGDPERYRVGFDITPVVVHPDQSKLAVQLFELGALGVGKLLEVTGFEAGDAPDEEELRKWIALTQVRRETIRPQTPTEVPAEAQQIVEQAPPSSQPTGVTASAGSLWLPDPEPVGAAPFASERAAWLD